MTSPILRSVFFFTVSCHLSLLWLPLLLLLLLLAAAVAATVVAAVAAAVLTMTALLI